MLAFHDAGITAYVPKPMTSGAKADGRFNNDAFIDDAAKNEYICPAGEALIWHYSYVEKGLKLHRYWSSKCQGCPLKLQCTPSTERRVRRWEHGDVLEEMQLKNHRCSRFNEGAVGIKNLILAHPRGCKNSVDVVQVTTDATRSICHTIIRHERQ